MQRINCPLIASGIVSVFTELWYFQVLSGIAIFHAHVSLPLLLLPPLCSSPFPPPPPPVCSLNCKSGHSGSRVALDVGYGFFCIWLVFASDSFFSFTMFFFSPRTL